jgi:heat shock protein HtpX
MNTAKSTLLLAGMTGLLLLVGELVGGRGGMAFALVIAAGLNFAAYFWSDKIVLRTYGARPVGPEDAPGLYEVVQRLALKAAIPVPRLYVIPDPALNAFATGRNPSHAAVAVTEGLLRALDREELEGVLAHELSHVLNRDTLISTIAATLGGAIGFLAHSALFFGGRHDDDDRGGAAGGLLAALLAPIAATLIQLAVSRSREYEADATGARVVGYPDGLARALRKLQRAAEQVPMDASPATAHLFIVNPLSGRGLSRLFSTHPPLEERIARLLALPANG